MIEGHDLPLAVSSWREAQEFYDQLKSFYDVLFTFVIAVVTVLSMVAIFAIISVSFLERLRELGSLRAIGTTRAELLSLLLVEALATYLAGAAAALGLGLAAGHHHKCPRHHLRPDRQQPPGSVPYRPGTALLPDPGRHHPADDRRRRAGSGGPHRP